MRSARIELAPAPWQGAVLPLNHDRDRVPLILNFKAGLIKEKKEEGFYPLLL